jgi:hypothetical protein
MFLTYHIFLFFPKNKEEEEEEDIVQDGSLALCRDH